MVGADVEFSHLVAYLKQLERTSSQLATIDLLSRLFNDADPEEIPILPYLLLGEIAPGYQEVTLDMGEKKVLAAISLAMETEEKEIERRLGEAGDLGSVIAEFDLPPHQAFTEYLSPPRPLTVRVLHQGLVQIASASGEGSDRKKIRILASLLAVATPEERRYIVRLVTGTMRLGVGDMTVLDGLAVSFLGSRESRSTLEQAYAISSDLGYVATVLQKSGLAGVKEIRIALNRPIHAMLAQRVGRMEEILEKIPAKPIAVEEKFDGERIQAHKDGDGVQLFSRRLTNVTRQFPDLVNQVLHHVRADTAILDGEAVAYDREHQSYYPFQKLMQRRRKYRVEEYSRRIPVRYMVFDLLYLDGSSQLEQTYPQRRMLLEGIVTPSDLIGVADRRVTSTLDGIRSYFQKCLDRGLEGVICKSMADTSLYQPGSRSWNWIKWKKAYGSELADTLDLVVIGGNLGRGKRKGTYGSLLCAAYNPDRDRFETVCGLGTGFSDEQLARLPQQFKGLRTPDIPARCYVRDASFPDHWLQPVRVLEVLGGEITRSTVHTCNWNDREKRGMALRFPRFIRWRPEKSPEQATTTAEIARMYRDQVQR
jgi:DNA ligase I, ATP-dependent (dnl1)